MFLIINWKSLAQIYLWIKQTKTIGYYSHKISHRATIIIRIKPTIYHLLISKTMKWVFGWAVPFSDPQNGIAFTNWLILVWLWTLYGRKAEQFVVCSNNVRPSQSKRYAKIDTELVILWWTILVCLWCFQWQNSRSTADEYLLELLVSAYFIMFLYYVHIFKYTLAPENMKNRQKQKSTTLVEF